MNFYNPKVRVLPATAPQARVRLSAVLVLSFWVLALSGDGAEARLGEGRQLAVGIYAGDGSTLAGTLRVERVFTEQRRIGFFRVKLMPVLVAQGVRLELARTEPGTNWTAGFRVKLSPLARSSRVEWRGVSISFRGESEPRLRARRLQLPDKPETDHCMLEELTLETDAGLVQVPRATLLLGSPTGTVVWDSNGFLHRWNLFTKTLITLDSNNSQADGSL